MPPHHRSLPDVWVVTDARNDARLETILSRLPRGSGIIFRHYHLETDERRRRYFRLRRLARLRGHLVALSGPVGVARRWGAQAAYGPPERVSRGAAMLRLVTAHSLHEIGKANRARADAIVLAPAFATRSHPVAVPLGTLRFRHLAMRSRVPVIALGGMNQARARQIGARKWAAIDGI